MSGQGFFYPGDEQQMALAQRLKMAQALMGNQANPATPYAGIANAGSDIIGAQAMKNIQNQQQQQGPANQIIQQRYGMTPSQAQNVISPSFLSRAGDWASNIFGMGGGG